MREILIISYFYPPCSLTAAQRPAGWVKHLHNFGFKPIVVTRHWGEETKTPENQLKSSGTHLVIDKNDYFEIHYLPYKSSLRDLFFTSENKILKFSSKILTLINALGENFSNLFIPYSSLYDYSKKLVKQGNIAAMIITANPYNQFRFGYLLHKEFNLPWIADYRDDWTTSEINTSITFNKFLLYFNKRSEKKWVGTSSMITSVSRHYTDKISSFVGVKGEVLLNGFEVDNYTTFEKDGKEDSCLKILYNGSLYDTQPIELFMEVVKEVNRESGEKIKLYFPGLAFNEKQHQRVLKLIEGFQHCVFISKRIAKNEVLQLQFDADILLMISHTGFKGIPSSKLYEYIGFKKPILLYPSDNDIIEETLLGTNLGLIFDNKDVLKAELFKYIQRKKDRIPIGIEPNKSEIENYSVFNQTKKLANLINQII